VRTHLCTPHVRSRCAFNASSCFGMHEHIYVSVSLSLSPSLSHTHTHIHVHAHLLRGIKLRGNLGHCDLNLSLGIVRVVNSGMLRRSGHFVGWEGKKFAWNCVRK
jgi:hypothetical protein